ncbi:MAG: hypothetical protein LBK73_00320 [Treponema sp.]|jgi:hypothetical protein|nr:hypothetical protein [Treponema sp.]
MTQTGLAFNYPIYTGKNSEEREKMKGELLTIVRDKNSPPFSTIGYLYLFMSALIASSNRIMDKSPREWRNENRLR